jgi:hypothetical protein
MLISYENKGFLTTKQQDDFHVAISIYLAL